MLELFVVLALLIGAGLLILKVLTTLIMVPIYLGLGLAKLLLWLVVVIPLFLIGTLLFAATFPILLLFLPVAFVILVVLLVIALPFLLVGGLFLLCNRSPAD